MWRYKRLEGSILDTEPFCCEGVAHPNLPEASHLRPIYLIILILIASVTPPPSITARYSPLGLSPASQLTS